MALSVLYLDPQDGSLQAYDDITLGGLGTSDARISRTVVADPSQQPPDATSPAAAGPS